ncbi:hypothetical protein [Carnobacterium maltaromaticum]|uniref:hypothetical protein n=1 Tax=Carnobacterium maltaromaticum TaxID=2751 RepID=UPI00295ED296|nr:hypothetical protein [Carnobacterium maltaromaticum]
MKKETKTYLIIGVLVLVLVSFSFYRKLEKAAGQQKLDEQQEKYAQIQKIVEEEDLNTIPDKTEPEKKAENVMESEEMKTLVGNLPFISATEFRKDFLMKAESREKFIRESVAESSRELFSKHLADAELPSLAQGTIQKAETSLGETFFMVSKDQKTSFLIVLSQGNIEHVYGEGWEVLPDGELEKIKQELSDNNPKELMFGED